MTKRDRTLSILGDDEKILWQGRPHLRLNLSMLGAREIGRVGHGLFYICLGTYFLYALNDFFEEDHIFGPVVTGLVVTAMRLVNFGCIALGFVLISRGTLWPLVQRRYSDYFVTNHAAYIAANIPGRGLRILSAPMDSSTRIEFVDGEPPSLIFDTASHFSASGQGARLTFHNIDDALKVMRLVHDLRGGRLETAPAHDENWQGDTEPDHSRPPPIPPQNDKR